MPSSPRGWCSSPSRCATSRLLRARSCSRCRRATGTGSGRSSSATSGRRAPHTPRGACSSPSTTRSTRADCPRTRPRRGSACGALRWGRPRVIRRSRTAGRSTRYRGAPGSPRTGRATAPSSGGTRPPTGPTGRSRSRTTPSTPRCRARTRASCAAATVRCCGRRHTNAPAAVAAPRSTQVRACSPARRSGRRARSTTRVTARGSPAGAATTRRRSRAASGCSPTPAAAASSGPSATG
jgi:hypothetical protein